MIRGLLGFLMILVGIHVGYTFTSPHINNRMLEGKMKDLLSDKRPASTENLHKAVMAFAAEKGIPLRGSDLIVTQVKKKDRQHQYTIAARYDCTAKFWFYERDYTFYPASHKSARLKPAPPQASSRGRPVRAGN